MIINSNKNILIILIFNTFFIQNIIFLLTILRITSALRDLEFPTQPKEENFSPFHFTELLLFCQRLLVSFIFLASIVTVFHFWFQAIIIFILFHVLRKSEDCLQEAVQSLCEGDHNIRITLKSNLFFFCFSNLFWASCALYTLFATLTKYDSILDAISASALVSLFVFLVVSSMKHIAFYFHFFRGYDIENGAFSILTMMSIIVRFIFVTPIWFCFLSDSPLTEFPEKFGVLPIAYLLAKIGSLWILCVDFAKICSSFFRSVFLRAPYGVKCEMCIQQMKKKMSTEDNNQEIDEETLLKSCPQADFTTQCGHSFCRNCIERARKVDSACPICHFHIPRKWTMPFKFGSLSTLVISCIF